MSTSFKRVDADECWASKKGWTGLDALRALAPLFVVRSFGEPDPGDEDKSSGFYFFEADNGLRYCLYERKQTSVYSPQLPPPEAFWRFRSVREFSFLHETDVERCEETEQAFTQYVSRTVRDAAKNT